MYIFQKAARDALLMLRNHADQSRHAVAVLSISGASALITACGISSVPATPSSDVPPQSRSGARPGPDLLYAPAPEAPQFENVAPWKASPILVSGALAYRQGEFLYQDFIYDDHGAGATASYPSDAVYANNAADLVEFRVKPQADSTAFRVTLNTLIDAEYAAFTIALGSSAASIEWPHGAGVTSPAAYFLTVHGRQAELIDALTGMPVMPVPTVSVDMIRRQFDVRVPHSIWNPGNGTVRMAAGVGVWDSAKSAYLMPTQSSSTAALYNVAFRFAEPISTDLLHSAPFGANWRDSAQGNALASGDISVFFAMVDFAKLLAGTGDESMVPSTGTINRIFSSQFEPAQGVDPSRTCGRSPATGCDGTHAGRLQPYALYVPDRSVPTQGWGMTLLLHELAGNYNSYAPHHWPQVLGDRGAGSLVLTPEGRGPDGDYTDLAEADIFEAWADVARHYPLDSGWAASAGYSMGGGGTLKMLARWPDLFGRGMSLAAVPQEQQESYRNNPMMIWIGNFDEGTPPNISLPVRSKMTNAGLQYTWYQFLTMDHAFALANDVWTGVPEFLGEARAKPEVPHITYVVNSCFDSERAGIANHAWWLSSLAVRDTDVSPSATVDAQSLAYGLGDPTPSGEMNSMGVLMGGTKGPQAYQATTQNLSDAPVIKIEDKLVVRARNLSAMAISMARAKLSCGAKIDVTTDGPLDVAFVGCGLTMHFDGQPANGGTTVTLPSVGVLPNVCDPTGQLPSGFNCFSNLPSPVPIFEAPKTCNAS